MKLLLVSRLSQSARSVYTIAKYVQVGAELGHEVAVFGEKTSKSPRLPYSLDARSFDYAIFVVYESWDFPDMPYLAQLLDGVPKDRRIIIDCCGRYNDTIRVEHDFNHLERMDGHQGWEWIEGFEAVSAKILQPTLNPLRPGVRPFLWHGFDPRAVVREYPAAQQAAQNWAADSKSYGMIYVGHNWQRWSQVGRLLESLEPVREQLGPICLAGCDWDKRPEWAIQQGIKGADLDTELLERLGVEVTPPIPYDEVAEFTSKARFSPVIHRPLFNHLRMVTNRTFSTFCADTIPILMLPEYMIHAVYGPQAQALAVGDNAAGKLSDMMRRPEIYWDVVLKTRAHLSEHHSFSRRFKELMAILES